MLKCTIYNFPLFSSSADTHYGSPQTRSPENGESYCSGVVSFIQTIKSEDECQLNNEKARRRIRGTYLIYLESLLIYGTKI